MEKNLKVVLLKYTTNPEETVALAAKLCYSPATSISDLAESVSKKDQSSFIKKLAEMNHLSPFEHASFVFGIEGVSRALSHQLVRHRIASFSQRSQRYVTHDDFDFIIPPSIAHNKKLKARFIQVMADTAGLYKEFSRKELGIPAEDARFLLPNACETKIIVTMNARELLHFFSVRCCSMAQWEIREMATQMLSWCKHTAPLLFKTAGPSCVRGKCPEGNRSCGNHKIIKKRFLEM